MSTDRTYGLTKDCRGCRYWSEMIAVSEGLLVKAMCLNQASLLSQQYTSAGNTCDAWTDGYLGAIDEPGDDPERYEKMERGARNG